MALAMDCRLSFKLNEDLLLILFSESIIWLGLDIELLEMKETLSFELAFVNLYRSLVMSPPWSDNGSMFGLLIKWFLTLLTISS